MDVLEPSIVRTPADAYAGLRSAVQEGERLAGIGASRFPQGDTWALKDRLADSLGKLREVVSQLEGQRCRG